MPSIEGHVEYYREPYKLYLGDMLSMSPVTCFRDPDARRERGRDLSALLPFLRTFTPIGGRPDRINIPSGACIAVREIYWHVITGRGPNAFHGGAEETNTPDRPAYAV